MCSQERAYLVQIRKAPGSKLTLERTIPGSHKVRTVQCRTCCSRHWAECTKSGEAGLSRRPGLFGEPRANSDNSTLSQVCDTGEYPGRLPNQEGTGRHRERCSGKLNLKRQAGLRQGRSREHSKGTDTEAPKKAEPWGKCMQGWRVINSSPKRRTGSWEGAVPQ